MKKLFMLIILFLLTVPLFSQTTTDDVVIDKTENSLLIRWVGVDLDSAGTVWSQSFTMDGYDGGNTVAQTLSTTTITTYDTVYAAADTTYSSTTATTTVYGDVEQPDIIYRGMLDAGKTTFKFNLYHYVNNVHPDSLSDWIVNDTLLTMTAVTLGKAKIDLNNTDAKYHKFKGVVPATGQAGKANIGFYAHKPKLRY